MPGQIPRKIWLYRIVHWENVDYILRNGIYTSNHHRSDPNYIDIGHRELIQDRNDYPVPGMPEAGNLGDFIPFYFGAFSPMLYAIMKGSSGVIQRPQEDIVYIISSLEKIKAANCEYCFTNKHAKTKLAKTFKDDEDLKEIDWRIVKAKQWNNTSHYLDRRDWKQAEFLVKSYVPVWCIEVIGVKNQERANFVKSIVNALNLDIKVYIDSKNQLYF